VIASAPAGALWGGAFGALAGTLSRLALKKVLRSSDAVFYSVFSAGILLRLLLLAAAVCLLRHERYIIVITFAVSLILFQTLFEAFPLKENGTKRNS